ncbi:MAG: hypothetical protein QXH80_00075 [Candidatus Nanoarchaeia archaeon]
MRKIFLSIFALIGIIAVCEAQLPVGTVRKSVMTDESGNVVSTPLQFSNQVTMIASPTNPLHLLRYQDMTNYSSVLNAITNITAVAPIYSTGTSSITLTWSNDLGYVTATITNGILSSAQSYADGATNALAQEKVSKSGDTMTGTLTLSNGLDVASSNFILGANGAAWKQISYINIDVDPPEIVGLSEWQTNIVSSLAKTNGGYVVNSTIFNDMLRIHVGCTNNDTLSIWFGNFSTNAIDPASQTLFIKGFLPTE